MFGSLRLSLPLVATALALVAAPADAAPTELKYKFEKGAKLKYRMSVKQDVDAEALGEGGGMGGMAAGGMKFNNSYEFTMTWTVLSVSDEGVAKIKSTITRVKGSVGSPMMGEMTFDTDDEGEAPADPDGGEGEGGGMGGGGMAQMGKFFGALKGGSAEFSVKPTGEITKLTGMDKLMKAAIEKLEGAMGGANGGQGGGPGGGMGGMGGMGGGGAKMMTRLLGNFGDSMWRPWMESALVRLPGKNVDLGDAWSAKVITPLPVGNAKIAMEYTYALAGTEGGIASFVVDGEPKLKKGTKDDIDEDDKLAKAMAEAMEFKEITESSTEGTASFDVAKGLITESKVKSKQVTTMSLDMGKIMEAFMGGAGGGMGGGMEMPKSEMKVTTTNTLGLKLLKATPADGGEGF